MVGDHGQQGTALSQRQVDRGGPRDSAYRILYCLESQEEVHSAQRPGPG